MVKRKQEEDPDLNPSGICGGTAEQSDGEEASKIWRWTLGGTKPQWRPEGRLLDPRRTDVEENKDSDELHHEPLM